MAEREKEETTSSEGEGREKGAPWGTLQELLLACAVDRHGAHCWDAIATELQKRAIHSSSSSSAAAFSPQSCRRKYADLRRRFSGGGGEGGDDDDESSGDGDGELLRMVEELRKLRMAELKREVERRDVSIVSLRLKVKRLEEERERSASKAAELVGNGTSAGDEPVRSLPARAAAGDSAEDRSFNESNSTNHNGKAEDKAVEATTTKEGEREPKARPEPAEPGRPRPGGKGRSARAGRPGESASESRRERERERQQSSDVQSSASLSKKKRRRLRLGGSSGDEVEAEEVSPANKRGSVKSKPLVRFFEAVRSHKHGSVFQRRLPSQETEKYQNVIRQHMDLDTVQCRLDKGAYCNHPSKFYRDLLLTFTNAVLFYRKSSAEHLAARELRKLVIDEIALRTEGPDKARAVKPDPEPHLLEPVVKKPRSSTTMVVCRRRSSMQALTDSIKEKEDYSPVNADEAKRDKQSSSKAENGRPEKPKIVQPLKKVDDGKAERESERERDGPLDAKKLITKERSPLGRGALRLSDNNGKKIISKDGDNREKMSKSDSNGKGETSNGEKADNFELRGKENGDQRQEKGAAASKKQGAASFLERMKQHSPSSQEKLKENDPEGEEEGGKGRKVEASVGAKKKIVNPKRGSKDAEVVVMARRNPSRRGERESATSRRGIGRPPKRKAAMMGATPDSGRGGKSGGRGGGEKLKKKPRR